MVPFLLIDLSFFGANLLKLFTGGYVPGDARARR